MATGRRPATVVPLMEADKVPGIRKGPNGKTWVSWALARKMGVRIPRHIKRAVGPRRRGVVYRSGYWGTLNTVHQVYLEVGYITQRGRAVRQAVWYEIVEQSHDDGARVRRHCTSWSGDGYGRKDEALFTIQTVDREGD